MRNRGELSQLIKNANKKPTVNIIRNDEELKVLTLRSSMRQRYLLVPLLFNSILEILAIPIRGKKEAKVIHFRKKKRNCPCLPIT